VGTSSSYGGPAGRNPLLPPWAEDPAAIPLDTTSPPPDASPSDGEDAPPDQSTAVDVGPKEPAPAPLPTPAPWGGVKKAMRGVAGSGARSDVRIRTLGRRFVNALGGSRRATASSGAARATGRRLGGFLAGVARDGIARTLTRLGLQDYLGQPVSALLVALGRVLTPIGETTEDAIAGAAYHETMAELVEELGVAVEGTIAFDRMDENLLRLTLERYVANVVTTRLLQVLAAELEGGAVTAERAVAVEFEIRDFVGSATALTFGQAPLTRLDWDSSEATTLIDRLFRQGYEIFGGTR
jgi:hypothetical protein